MITAKLLSTNLKLLTFITKKAVTISRNCLYLWTSQGLNLGPPDYESVLDLFHEITNNVKALKISALIYLSVSKNFVNLQQFSGEKVT